MDIRQVQTLLKRMGFDPGAIDGIWGTASQAALDAALAEYGKDTNVSTFGTFWDEIQYFKRSEFRCPCPRCGGFPVEPNEKLVRLADAVRKHFDSPMTISSGVRCQAHNDELSGSVPNSRHVQGKAVDFNVRGKSADQVLAYVKGLGVRYAYKIDNSYVHMDVD